MLKIADVVLSFHEKVCEKSIELVIMEADLEFFIEEIKKINRSKD